MKRQNAPAPAPLPPEAVSVAGDLFAVASPAAALLDRGVIAAPLLAVWQYRIVRPEPFRAWLAAREIVLADRRLSIDPEVADVRYLGTWRVAGTRSDWQTLWGYRSRAALDTLQRLTATPRPAMTIIQAELADFVTGLKAFVGEAGARHVREWALVAAACDRESDLGPTCTH